LADIYGGGKNLGDVKFDMVTTTPQSTQSQTATVYWENFGVANQMKFRMDMSQEGSTMEYLVDYSTETAYMYTPATNTAYKISLSQAPSNPLQNADQIHPTYLGTDTVDGNLCDVWQWTTQVTGVGTSTSKVWIWKAKSFPVKMELTDSSGTTTIEYQNIVFGTLDPSLFELPAGVTITTFPS
jgi:outer membrane lipoprotein-sorting protein